MQTQIYVLLALAPVLAGCQKKLPTAPSMLSSGIVIYEHANYQGESALIEATVSNLHTYKGPCEETSFEQYPASAPTFSWKNCASSIRVAPGWKATLFTDTDFGGKSLEVTSDVSNLQLTPGDCNHGGFNDCVESIRIARQ